MGRTPLYAAFFLAAILAGCGSPISSGKNEGVPYDASNPSGSDPGSGSGVNDSSGFFLKMTSDTAHTLKLHRSSAAYGSASHPTTGFTQECRIAGDASLYTNIVCIAEVEELDLYFSELKVQYHVPRNMCRYLRHNPYHFWENEPGYGNHTVSWDVTSSGAYENEVNSSGGKPTPCPYDYTTSGGPNCCLGQYKKSVRIMNAGGGYGPPSETIESWGGKPGNCLFGPAMDSQQKTAAQLPKPDIFYVEGTGLNQTYTIKPAIDMSFGNVPVLQNLWAANYYSTADHGGDKPITMRRGPNFVPPPWTPTPAPPPAPGYLPSDTYDFSCLDAAEEVKYRIRLMIREWNQNPVVEGGDPDLVGTDPGDPNADINDRLDWKDVNNYPRDNYL